MALDADLLERVNALTGVTQAEGMLEQVFNIVMAELRVLAPCKREDWQAYEDLPGDVQTAIVSTLSRIAQNPRGIRQETIGEYSYTLASGLSVNGPFSPSERRIINALSECGGGSTYSLTVESPPVLVMDAPDTDGAFSYWRGTE